MRSADPLNATCFDCNDSDASWASLIHGVFICTSCVSLHRGLGKFAANQTKHTELDKWTIHQLQLMWLGGNTKFLEYLTTYSLEKEDFEKKYKSRAAAFYRRKLASLISEDPQLIAEVH